MTDLQSTVIELNWEPRNIYAHIWSNHFWQSCQGHSNEGRKIFSVNCVKSTEYPHGKEWSWTLNSHHLQKMNSNGERLNVKAKIIHLLERNVEGKLSHWIFNDFLDMTPKAQTTKVNKLGYPRLVRVRWGVGMVSRYKKYS